MKRCVDIASSSTIWTDEALARAKYRLALLYERQGIEPDRRAELRREALQVLNKYKQFITDWVAETGDERIMLDDLQPTDEGRFVGRLLMRELWRRREAAEKGS